MQFAHARCLAEELDMLGATGRKVPPATMNWPDGFTEVFEFAHIGGKRARPREFDNIAQIGGDNPHVNYPMRNIGEANFPVTTGKPPSRIGTLTMQQAIREAYPGAIYLHLAQGFKVSAWRSSAFDRAIRVYKSKSRAFTRPLIRKFVNLSIDDDGLVGGHFRTGESGFLAECQLQITERVEGYEEKGEKKLYKNLRHEDPSMTNKTRDFRTTGVVLSIEGDWVKQSGSKQRLADALRDLLVRQYSISPQDVDAASSYISVISGGHRRPISNAVVIYDATYGSLRLSEPIYTELDSLISLLFRATELTGGDSELLASSDVEQLRGWYSQLNPEQAEGFFELVGNEGSAPEDWQWVFAEGSVVGLRGDQGILRDIEIIEPQVVALDGPPQLFYKYKIGSVGNALAPADKIENTGDEWRMVLWNPLTGETKEPSELETEDAF